MPEVSKRICSVDHHLPIVSVFRDHEIIVLNFYKFKHVFNLDRVDCRNKLKTKHTLRSFILLPVLFVINYKLF